MSLRYALGMLLLCTMAILTASTAVLLKASESFYQIDIFVDTWMGVFRWRFNIEVPSIIQTAAA